MIRASNASGTRAKPRAPEDRSRGQMRIESSRTRLAATRTRTTRTETTLPPGAVRAGLLAAAGLASAALAAGSAGSASAADGDAAPPAVAGLPLQKFFGGKVLSLKGRTIEISYDFEDPGQLADFDAACPFRAIADAKWKHERGRVTFTGTGSMRHKAVFEDKVSMAAKFTPRKPRDFGFAATEDRESEIFTLYCCYDRYFSAGDNVHVPQNMVIKFLARDLKRADGMQDWRYCGSRGQNPEIRVGETYRVTMSRTGLESQMAIGDDFTSKGKEAGREMVGIRLAVYGYDASVEVDDLVLKGDLDPAFVAKHNLDLASWKPPVPPPAETAGAAGEPAIPDSVRERVRAQIADYPIGTKPAVLATLLRDEKLPASLRAEAAEKAKSSGVKKIVPHLVEGLYSPDVEARKLSFDVLKHLTGKNFAYRPEGPEDQRKKSVLQINEHLQKHAADYQ
ncbi:MAG: hypothetical protein HMLKMBBP_00770 [Planctomycetes bacterium]|nr:hypothetical protein [Planctomycetota bacterium]